MRESLGIQSEEEKRLDINQVYSSIAAAAMALVTAAAAVYTHILRDSVIIISSSSDDCFAQHKKMFETSNANV